MGVGITKSPEGAQALRTMSATLLQELENISKAADDLQQTYEEVKQNLAHEDEIQDILDGIREVQAHTSVPIATLSTKANQLATLLEDFLGGRLGGQGN